LEVRGALALGHYSMIETSIAEPLLTCLRLDQGAGKLADLRSLSPSDWDLAVEQARLYHVMPLLFWEIKNQPGLTALPEGKRQELHHSFVTSTSRNLLLFRELADILKALQPAGIPVILLKGLHLAKWVYPEIALRPMGDIDLLLHTDDLARAASILQGLGYRFIRAFKLEREVHKHQHIPRLWQPGKAVVELHWHIATPGSPLTVDLEGLWRRAEPVEVAGASALVLSPEDLLLHINYHLMQEEFIRGLKRLYDIAALTSYWGERLDWLQLQQRAEVWNFRKGLFLGLHLSSALLNAYVPQNVLDQLYPADFNPQLDLMAQQRVLSLDSSMPEVNPNLTRLRRRRPVSAKAARLLSILFPYPEIVAAKLSLPSGTKVTYFHYLMWLNYLARRYGPEFWRMVRNDDATAELVQSENAISDWWMAR
jgi:Uncharacterised nucleotidyltransferase